MKNIHINTSWGIISILVIAVLVVGGVWTYRNSLLNDLNISFFSRDLQGDGNENEQDFQMSDSGNVTVFEPAPNDTVGLPLEVRGEARVFEGTVNFRLLDGDGSTLAETFTTTRASDVGEFGEFSTSISYPEPDGDRGTLEVFSISARDGSDIDMVRIPVMFADVEALTVRVYFTTTTTGVVTCEATEYVERRIPRTQAVARAAINELLKGPTVGEIQQDFRTSINTGTELQSVRIENGIAYADFDSTLGLNIGGSCMVQAIRTQISNTLEQFDTVDDVVISINGESEEILQP